MTTSTFYGFDSGTYDDGWIRRLGDEWYGETYQETRQQTDGETILYPNTASTWLGQSITGTSPNEWYYLHQFFIAFDTSSIPDSDTISAVTFSLYAGSSSAGSTTYEARTSSWAPLANTSWRKPSNGYGNLLASISSASWSGSGYKDFTSESEFLTTINKTGYTEFYCIDYNLRLGIQQTAWAEHYASESIASQDPKLVVVHSSGGVTEDVLQAAESDAGIGMATFGHPENLIATVISENRVDLTWNAVTGATAYEVFRDGTYLDTVGTESYSDQAISSHSHRWQVRTVI